MTAATNTSKIYGTEILRTTVEAPTKAGGFIGDIAEAIYRNGTFYYNNYIEANVISQEGGISSLIIGGRPEENPYIQNTYVYKYSKLNGEYVYNTNDVIEEKQYLVRKDLEQQATYTNKIKLSSGYFSFESLKNGKYPKIKDNLLYEPELQQGIELPVDPTVSQIVTHEVNEEIVVQDIELIKELPDVKAYNISEHEFNIDFSEMPENTYFTYSVNGQDNNKEIKIEQKTYTFEYNYQDTIDIKLIKKNSEEVFKGTEENKTSPIVKTITIKPEDLISKISLTGDKYAYLENNKLYVGDTEKEGEYVNLYKGKALNKEGYVYDLETETIILEENIVTKIKTNTEPKTGETKYISNPQATYTYNGNKIDTYGTYSKINGNIKAQIYTVKNGRLSGIANNSKWRIGNVIIDNFNGKEYQTVLNTEGKLETLKEELKYPSNFLNDNIVQIAQNENGERPEVMVCYEEGKVLVFNYVTGEIIFDNNVKNNVSLFSFVKNSFQNVFADNSEKEISYEESKELVEKLEKTPIEKAIEITKNDSYATINNNNSTNVNIQSEINQTNITNSNNSKNNEYNKEKNQYITLYNPKIKEYEVYKEDEIIESREELISETEKIEKNIELNNFYNYNNGNRNTNSGIIIIATIVVIIVFLLFILKIYIHLKNNEKQ